MPDEPANKEIKPKLQLQPIDGQPSGLLSQKRFDRKIVLWVVAILIAIILVAAGGVIIWYNIQLGPVNDKTGQFQKVIIAKNSTSGQISKELESQSIIRSAFVFDIYVRLLGKNNLLQAGTYHLSASETTPQIVKHLTNGSVDRFNITFYPGATLVDKTDSKKKYDVTTILKNAGYSDQEISAALKKTYQSPIFVDKPAGSDLEGYIYGETYNYNSGATVEDIFDGTLDQFYKVVKDNKLIESFQSHGLSLFEGITLASIVQREANSADDQKKVAQVFYSRLSIGMALGSDVTYQYIADKTGIARDPNLDSPYNTRRYTGLPPGPISVPGFSALMAVAQPASTDYLYFLSDSDGRLYFAHTDAEHQANIVNFCKEACATP